MEMTLFCKTHSYPTVPHTRILGTPPPASYAQCMISRYIAKGLP